MSEKDLGKCSTGLQPNVAALLCYLAGFITGIVFYVLEKDNKFIKFHAMQSIITFGALFVIGLIIPAIPILGWILMPVVSITSIVLWVLMMVKAYQGETFKLPIAGDIAEKNS